MAADGEKKIGGPRRQDRGRPRVTVKDGPGEVGAALRSVYQQTVEEQVPDEFMALLNKLD